ncbi:hypothetical protein V8C86DRAFT_2903749 [Haematococcus lacustris]
MSGSKAVLGFLVLVICTSGLASANVLHEAWSQLDVLAPSDTQDLAETAPKGHGSAAEEAMDLVQQAARAVQDLFIEAHASAGTPSLTPPATRRVARKHHKKSGKPAVARDPPVQHFVRAVEQVEAADAGLQALRSELQAGRQAGGAGAGAGGQAWSDKLDAAEQLLRDAEGRLKDAGVYDYHGAHRTAAREVQAALQDMHNAAHAVEQCVTQPGQAPGHCPAAGPTAAARPHLPSNAVGLARVMEGVMAFPRRVAEIADLVLTSSGNYRARRQQQQQLQSQQQQQAAGGEAPLHTHDSHTAGGGRGAAAAAGGTGVAAAATMSPEHLQPQAAGPAHTGAAGSAGLPQMASTRHIS